MGRQQGGQGSFGVGFMLGAIAGAGVMFVLDPLAGHRRRSLARDQVARLGNGVDTLITESLPGKVDYLAGVARGALHQVAGATDQQLPDEDRFITDRVMSMVFRDPSLPKGGVNVNTVDQVVYLHGHVGDAAVAAEIERRVRDVPGVRDVVNVINRPDVDPSAVRANQVRQEEKRS